MPARRRLTRLERIQVAGRVPCDPRAVLSYFEGRRQPAALRAAIERVLVELDLAPSPSAPVGAARGAR
jgi:hypothetical protein